MFNYLSAIVFLPVIGAIIIALISGKQEKSIKWVAAIFTFVTMVLAFVIFGLDTGHQR
jgi:NADH:ubiquinone oxidoreductase subunit 4 (subunit M)